MRDGFAYCAARSEGLWIVDVSNPTNATVVSSLDVGSEIKSLMLSGNTAYLGGLNSSLYLVDVANPLRPALVKTNATLMRIMDFTLAEPYAYLSVYPGGIRVVDVSDILSPQIVGGVTNLHWFSESVSISGQHAFLANNQSGLAALDIQNPQKPRILVTNLFETRPNEYQIIHAVIQGGKAYVAAASNGLMIMDISNDLSWNVLGSVKNGCWLNRVAIAGNYAYLSDDNGGLHVFDIQDVTAPKLVESHQVALEANDVVVSGRYVYLATRGSGLCVFERIDEAGFGPHIENQPHLVKGATNDTMQIEVTVSGAAPMTFAWRKDGVLLSNDEHFSGATTNILTIHDVHLEDVGEYLLEVSNVWGKVASSLIDFNLSHAPYVYEQPKNIVRAVGETAQFGVAGESVMSLNYRWFHDGVEMTDNARMHGSTDAGVQIASVEPSDAGCYWAQLYDSLGIAVTEEVHLEVVPRKDPSIASVWPDFVRGFVTQMTFKDSLAYCALSTNGIWIVDITNPVSPHSLCNYSTRTNCLSVEIKGHFIAAATGWNGLEIVDVGDPAKPRYVCNVTTGGYAKQVLVHDEYAFVVNDGAGLSVVDLMDPLNPRLVHSMAFEGGVLGGSILENTCILALGTNGMAVVDISNPTQLILAGVSNPGGTCRCVAIDGHYALMGYDSGFRVVDIANPAVPIEVSVISTTRAVNAILVKMGVAHVMLSYGDVLLYDLSNAADIKEIGRYGLVGTMSSIAVQLPLAMVAQQNYGLVLVDVHDPAHVQMLGELQAAGTGLGIYATDATVIMADHFSGLRGFKRLPSGSCEYSWSLMITGSVADVVGDGQFLYATTARGLRVVDIGDFTTPRIVAQIDDPSLYGKARIFGRTVYVASINGGVTVVDVSNPLKPVIGRRIGGSGCSDVGVYGTNLCITSGSVVGNYSPNSALTIYDQSSGFSYGSLKIPGSALGVAVKDTVVFVAAGTNGLVVVDATDPYKPRQVGHFHTEGRALGVTLNDRYALVACDGAGIEVIDVSAPDDPYRVGWLDTRGEANSLQVVDHFVYVADGTGGLTVLNLQPSSSARPVQLQMLQQHPLVLQISGGLASKANIFQSTNCIDWNEWKTISILDSNCTQITIEDDMLEGPRYFIVR